jgi:hypothetical protein
MSIREIIGQRGKTLLVVENHKYSECNRKLSSGEVKWRCVNRKCKAFLHSMGDSCDRILTKSNLTHNHGEITENVLQRHAVSASAKRKAVDDICEKPSKILHKCIDSEHGELQVRDLNCIKKSIYYSRRKKLPKLPSCAEEVFEVLKNMNIVTIHGEQFVLFNEMSVGLVVFCAPSNLKYLCASKTLYMDGTFSYCTKYFQQLFTIHGLFNGHYIPLVFCLLQDKSTSSYVKCFKKLIEISKNVSLEFAPCEIVIDFEYAIHNAVKLVWGEIKIIGCRFHLTQAWCVL